MKFLALTLLLLSGCSVLDDLKMNETRYRDSGKIYLDAGRVRGTEDEISNYGCASGAPMFCERAAVVWECRC